MTAREELERQIRSAPDLPGAYLFRDGDDSVLYVGKAVSLRRRLASYGRMLGRGGMLPGPGRAVELQRRIQRVEWIVTSTEVEALLLEHNLIRQHRPPYNIRLRDDKSYPYIVVTATDEYPRVMFTREPHRRGHRYFGPYGSAAKVRETLDTLGRVFPFRKCRGAEPGRRSGTPCLQFHIDRCPAPCEGRVSPEEYGQTVSQVIAFLEGREQEVIEQLEEGMRRAAEGQDFERAALLRDRSNALRHVLERQRVRSTGMGTADVVGMAVGPELANVQVFQIRDGLLADRRSFLLENVEVAEQEEVFERFFAEYYSSVPAVPPAVIVPEAAGDPQRLHTIVKKMRGADVEVRRAERGEWRRLREMAERNAALALEHEQLRRERRRERRQDALAGLQAVAGLETLPLRIEGYDVSNLGGENMVVSMVVFEAGRPLKSDYRRFSVRTLSGPDDPAALREVVSRRFGRRESGGAEGEYDPAFETVPDLVLVDGGKPQLSAVTAVLEQLGLEEAVPVISLAKREEEIYVPGRSRPVRLDRDDAALLLLQRVRDEAHRFALSHHRRRRQAGTGESFLDGLPGIGEKRKKAILNHFGSPERFLGATREEIEGVPGLPGKVARRVYDHLHKTG